jgi:ABC-type phosphate transport system permease subunit
MGRNIKIHICLSIIWLILCVTVLPLTGEGALMTMLGSSLLAMPTGLFFVVVYSFLGEVLTNHMAESTVTMMFIIPTLICGVGQWFIFKKVRAKMKIIRGENAEF